ncbi:flavodoxin [Halobacteriovorax marinus]|uniref:Flavodoxin n=1 Tax=Halobacteriovorax marinus TaxID=97084 RepID=A0A1Y5F4D1_9BACT|nr:flavodoxin [Halobacteriovorax marinus]
MESIGIFYGSNIGNTEDVATKVKNVLKAEIFNISDVKKEQMSNYDFLIFASSTWGTGELSDDWEEHLQKLDELDLNHKYVGFIGLGDQYSYGDTFCDALSIIYNRIKDKGIKLIGQWPTEGYDHEESESILDGKFLGLVIDEDNQDELTDERINKWVLQVRDELKSH